jgi:hypothetical protein
MSRDDYGYNQPTGYIYSQGQCFALGGMCKEGEKTKRNGDQRKRDRKIYRTKSRAEGKPKA